MTTLEELRGHANAIIKSKGSVSIKPMEEIIESTKTPIYVRALSREEADKRHKHFLETSDRFINALRSNDIESARVILGELVAI